MGRVLWVPGNEFVKSDWFGYGLGLNHDHTLILIEFEVFPRVQDELPAVPLPREQLSQGRSGSEPEEIPDW